MRSSLGWPITLGVVMLLLVVLLLIGWIIFTFGTWPVLITGTVFLVLVGVGVVLYLSLSIKEIALNRRQSNFIDSVTHELKSPIASLKLYLQTLNRRSVTEKQQADFYRFMLDDVERLDTLINHMLDAARLGNEPVESDDADVNVAITLKACAETVCQRYHLPDSTIKLDLAPAIVRAKPIDVEMLFRNLIDNAVKYGGTVPSVEIMSYCSAGGMVITRIIDNGQGIPHKLRRKIFGRFVRLGSELERKQPGTGLGLFIVRTLVRRLRGKVTVRDRTDQSGTIFQVELPGRPQQPDEPSSDADAATARDGVPQQTNLDASARR
jgi:two-component system, OmpR family, phosphate regulon sensor histidine kinase PhoR